MTTNFNDDEILNEWYRYAAKQETFVGSWLRTLREHQKITLEQQQRDFGVTGQEFMRLQGMPLPRPNQFTRDARRIADVCHITNPSAFVQAMLLARGLGRNQDFEANKSQLIARNFYQAAYDADEDLDKPSDEDEK